MICRAAGFAGIEGHARLFPDTTEIALAEERSLYTEAGLMISSFHLPYGEREDIAALAEADRKEAVATAKHWLSCAAQLGARVAILHPTTRRLDMRIEGEKGFLRALERSLGELLPLAEQLGVVIALENLPPANGGRLGTSPEHFTLFLEKFRHPFLGFCLDTGHALLAGHDRAEAFYDAMKPALQAFHLTDNAGDRDSHLAPGRGLVRWTAVRRLLDEIGFAYPACIEAPPFAYGPLYDEASWCRLRAETCDLLA